jgi:hypothetical protein
MNITKRLEVLEAKVQAQEPATMDFRIVMVNSDRSIAGVYRLGGAAGLVAVSDEELADFRRNEQGSPGGNT